VVFRTGRPARRHNYDDATDHAAAVARELGIRSSVGAPIMVDERLWGVMIALSNEERPIAADTESRMAAFTELVATALSNTEAKTETARLAEEQAALRRVATLVARAVPPDELFAAVAEEVGTLIGTDFAGMVRYEADKTVTPMATWAALGEHPAVPDRWPLEEGDPATMIAQTGGPARIDDWDPVPGPLAAFAREELGLSSSVGSPILVEGRLWGALAVHSKQPGPLPPNTESRLLNFTELVGTAVANAQARSDQAASRARIVAAADEERRRVVRDLHDGAQQRLVQSIITLKLVRRALERNEQRVPELVSEALEHAERANVELRELAQGILPAVLTRGGLRSAVEALASRAPVPVEISVTVDRFAAPVEATAYFVIAESLTNVAKHAHATGAAVRASVEDGCLQLEVRDDGVGGARREGTGLVGLADRLAALDGEFRVDSPAGGGTIVAAAIPLPRQR
jgi:signal transduction histidine kinase